MAKYIVTFCNAGEGKIAVIDGDRIERTLPIGYGGPETRIFGTTGIAPYRSQIAVAVQSDPCAVVLLGRHLTVDAVIPLPETKDIHGLTPFEDGLLVASTGTDQILHLNPETRQVTPFWFNGVSLSDTIHLNDIAVVGGAMAGGTVFCTQFGLREPDNLRNGQIVDTGNGESAGMRLREPHSLAAFDGSLYVLESATGDLLRFRKGFEPKRVVGIAGYARGLAVDGERFAIGKSGFRANSRSSLGDARVPPLAASDTVAAWMTTSGVFLIDRATLNATFVDTTAIGLEIYQIMKLPQGFIDTQKQDMGERAGTAPGDSGKRSGFLGRLFSRR